MSGGLARELLKRQRRPMEQLQCSGDPLQEMRLVVLGRFIARPQRISDLGHRGEAVVHLGGIALSFPRVAPRPVDADTTSPGLGARSMVLVIGTCRQLRAHRDPSY